jgi:effector-binding domain-containing protein
VVLKSLGLSLEEVSQLLNNDPSVSQIIQMLRVKQAEIRQRLHDEGKRLEEVEKWLKQIEKEGTMPAYDVIIKKVEAQRVASLRDTIPTYSDVGQLFNEIFGYLFQQKAQFAGPSIGIYHDMEYREKDVDVEVAVPLANSVAGTKRIKVHELPSVKQMACTIHKGPYEMIGDAYRAVMTWVDINGYEFSGPNREVYLEGPGQGKDPASYVTEVQFPIAKK